MHRENLASVVKVSEKRLRNVWAFFIQYDRGGRSVNYGPYFAVKVSGKTIYLGRLGMAAYKLSRGDRKLFCEYVKILAEKVREKDYLTVYEKNALDGKRKVYEKVRELRSKGMKLAEIAKRLNISISTVHYMCYHWPKRGRNRIDEVEFLILKKDKIELAQELFELVQKSLLRRAGCTEGFT